MAGLAIGAIAALSLSMRQVARVPDWYTTEAPTEISSSSPTLPSSQLLERLATSSAPVELNSQQVNQLVAEAIARSSEGQALLQNGFSTTIEDGQIKGGVVVNLSELPTDGLTEQERAALDRVLAFVPALGRRGVYLGIEGNPTVRNGKLQFDENMTVKVGNLSLPASVVASQLGLSLTELEARINAELEARGIDLRDVRVEGDRLVINSQ
ncbi:hypothetical protein HPC62_04200 [Thermoleptolyngbya sichuanensis A183]|uniref:DUF2993 domain-containing protein n=1 Tax=Thermoleptolyngbya sichuanensis A183 TaxID=2737172 RepID=A0A6M8B2Y1_9CYAN|nr:MULTISPECIES: hypothetical protein [Thermoleptolyngbya]MDG2614838.1 hypothetical protein [Thermoleptolyngbya sichuanensis XZ-Cy5]QKD81489.1 hypothetical protein HPC62_04200 [Thermoleptolyngbya sichuanensis A183]